MQSITIAFSRSLKDESEYKIACLRKGCDIRPSGDQNLIREFGNMIADAMLINLLNNAVSVAMFAKTMDSVTFRNLI
jgi:hypothetical protein